MPPKPRKREEPKVHKTHRFNASEYKEAKSILEKKYNSKISIFINDAIKEFLENEKEEKEHDNQGKLEL